MGRQPLPEWITQLSCSDNAIKVTISDVADGFISVSTRTEVSAVVVVGQNTRLNTTKDTVIWPRIETPLHLIAYDVTMTEISSIFLSSLRSKTRITPNLSQRISKMQSKNPRLLQLLVLHKSHGGNTVHFDI